MAWSPSQPGCEIYKTQCGHVRAIFSHGIFLALHVPQGDVHVEKLNRSAELLRQLPHPEFLRLMGSVEGFTTELCPTTLEDLVHGLRWRPAPALLASVALDVANALEHLHDMGEFHCDLHPRNLFVTENCNCKMGIFGCPNAAAPSPFVAPEVVCGGPFTAAADVYAFGATVCELATGLRASHGVPEAGHVTWAPLAALLKKCTNPSPQRRPAIKQVVAELCDLVRSLDVPAPYDLTPFKAALCRSLHHAARLHLFPSLYWMHVLVQRERERHQRTIAQLQQRMMQMEMEVQEQVAAVCKPSDDDEKDEERLQELLQREEQLALQEESLAQQHAAFSQEQAALAQQQAALQRQREALEAARAAVEAREAAHLADQARLAEREAALLQRQRLLEAREAAVRELQRPTAVCGEAAVKAPPPPRTAQYVASPTVRCDPIAPGTPPSAALVATVLAPKPTEGEVLSPPRGRPSLPIASITVAYLQEAPVASAKHPYCATLALCGNSPNSGCEHPPRSPGSPDLPRRCSAPSGLPTEPRPLFPASALSPPRPPFPGGAALRLSASLDDDPPADNLPGLPSRPTSMALTQTRPPLAPLDRSRSDASTVVAAAATAGPGGAVAAISPTSLPGSDTADPVPTETLMESDGEHDGLHRSPTTDCEYASEVDIAADEELTGDDLSLSVSHRRRPSQNSGAYPTTVGASCRRSRSPDSLLGSPMSGSGKKTWCVPRKGDVLRALANGSTQQRRGAQPERRLMRSVSLGPVEPRGLAPVSCLRGDCRWLLRDSRRARDVAYSQNETQACNLRGEWRTVMSRTRIRSGQWRCTLRLWCSGGPSFIFRAGIAPANYGAVDEPIDISEGINQHGSFGTSRNSQSLESWPRDISCRDIELEFYIDMDTRTLEISRPPYSSAVATKFEYDDVRLAASLLGPNTNAKIVSVVCECE